MVIMVYREYLISEIQRFHNGNGRVPGNRDMRVDGGYPSYYSIVKEFGSWNNAVEAAGFIPDRVGKRNNCGFICSICDTKEAKRWFNSDKGKICKSCYEKDYYIKNEKQNKDYMNGRLDADSTVGKGFIGERVVAKVLHIKSKYDCNCGVNFHHPDFDMIQLDNEKYGRIQVKTSTLIDGSSNSRWLFELGNKCDTYVMLGFDEDRSNIIKVWIIPSDKNIVSNKTGLKITLNPTIIRHVAREIVKYEVDAKPYNDAYHSMNLDGCGYLTKK